MNQRFANTKNPMRCVISTTGQDAIVVDAGADGSDCSQVSPLPRIPSHHLQSSWSNRRDPDDWPPGGWEPPELVTERLLDAITAALNEERSK